jgi:acetoacetate decarboxylase
MGMKGQLTKERRGYSLPLDSPLYGPLPITYQNVTLLLYEYETNPEAAAALLPDQLELPDRCTVKALFASYPWTSLGAYNESAQLVKCLYKGKPYDYAVRLHVTNDAAMAAGREIAGFPKKMADINFTANPEYAFMVERPTGVRLATAVMRPVQRITTGMPPFPITFDYICLRVIPDPSGQAPSLVQLVETDWVLQSGQMWAGQGSLQFTGSSDLDPYHTLPIRRMVNTSLFMGEMLVDSTARVLETL